MSRNIAFSYEAELPGVDVLTIHEEVCGVVIPQRVCNGGGSEGPLVSFWLYANKTKARRLAKRLDAHFAAAGVLNRLDETYPEETS